ncbi:MAG: DUF86 domain-containing protein [Syntrophomonas sp.]
MKTDILYLRHILESTIKIAEYTDSGKHVFMNSPIIQDAVIRNLEIIGEATKKLSGDYRDQHPEIPWKQMAAMRDVLIHDYMGIDFNIVWNVVVKELPSIRDVLTKLLK